MGQFDDSFPEGQLNRNPRQIQTLRRGAFSLPIKHARAVYGFVNVGCERAWPHGAAMGGFPCEIDVRLFKVTDDASKYNNIELAELAGREMQRTMDAIHASIDVNRKSE